MESGLTRNWLHNLREALGQISLVSFVMFAYSSSIPFIMLSKLLALHSVHGILLGYVLSAIIGLSVFWSGSWLDGSEILKWRFDVVLIKDFHQLFFVIL